MEVLLLDPQAEYAEHFVRLLTRVHGLRPVALHTSWRTRVMGSHRYPAVRSAAVTNYVIGDRPLPEVARMLQERHTIVAVAPHHESTLLPLHELAVHLGLSWAQPQVVPLFRDKGGLKAHLRNADPSLRLNHSRVVADGQAARDFAQEVGAERIVLKPNDGAGNVDVAFFDATASAAELSAHIEGLGRPLLAEEFIGGDEYYVNGQMDGAGVAHIISVVQYIRVPHAGKENVEIAGRVLKTQEPQFSALADYARRVLTATGLRRSPFHLEAKVDQQGPCLIEVAARMCGAEGAFTDSRLHGFDAVEHALSHYLRADAPPPPLDWATYDRLHRGFALGLADDDAIVHTLSGVAEVEAMPEFVTWIDRPRVGQKVRQTVDLVSSPWIAELAAPSLTQLERAWTRAQDLVTWNDDAHRGVRLRGAGAYSASKILALSHLPTLLARTEHPRR